MSKLSFRARALDCARPLAVWLGGGGGSGAGEEPEPGELQRADCSAISRAVPAMPTGMEKDEESEHHLQRAICTGLIIPTPEVTDAADLDFYERCYPADYKMPRQLIHMQPLCLEAELPEYDMDSEDERWLRQQRRAELTELKFEEMMERLERSSGQTVVTLSEAKLLLQRHDDLVIAVYDYWLNKRLNNQHPLILTVKTENRAGQSANNPYLAFRRRTEKMQTRKNRKNDESSYEKMLKLRRELSRAATLLELVSKRELAKRELVRLTALLHERRFASGDYSAQPQPISTVRTSTVYPAVSLPSASAPVRRDTGASHFPPRPSTSLVEHSRQREKRQYKRRKQRHQAAAGPASREGVTYSSSDEELAPSLASVAVAQETRAPAEPAPVTPVDDGPFAFRRKAGVYYQMPTSTLGGDYEVPESPTSAKDSLCTKDKRFRFTLTSINRPYPKCIGFARRRLGRGGRVILDRISTPLDDLWPHLQYNFPKSTTHGPHDTFEADTQEKRYQYAKEMSRDFHQGGKHSWRRAFRQHYANNPNTWTKVESKSDLDLKTSDFSDYVKMCDDVNVSDPLREIKSEKMDDVCEVPQDSIKLNGDISIGCEERVRATLSRYASRKRARRRASDSSDDGRPAGEWEFDALCREVNTEWLHFRLKTPPAEPERAPDGTDRLAISHDTPISVEVRLGNVELPSKMLFDDMTPFTTSEFTLADLYGDSLVAEPDSASLDVSGEDLNEFSGLTDAQVESILSDTDLKVLAEDDKKHSMDLLKPDEADAILEALVKDEVNGKTEDPFLLAGQSAAGRNAQGASNAYSGHKRRKKVPKFNDFGSSVVTVTPIDNDEPIYVDLIPPAPPELPVLLPPKASTPIQKVVTPVPPPPIKIQPSNPTIIKQEVIKIEPKKRLLKDEVLEDVQLGQGVQLKTVQTKHSPLKKHIITSAAHRRNPESLTLVTSQESGVSQPQIVTVAVSESLKMRLQNHLLANQSQGLVTIDGTSMQTSSGATVVGLMQNGPFTVSSAGMALAVSSGGAVVSRDGGISMAGVASTSSPRRVAPVVHLTPAALHQKQLQQLTQQQQSNVVVAHPHSIQHVAPNKLKVLHAHSLTQSQRTQLLAQTRNQGLNQLPAVVSLSTLGEAKSSPNAALQLKTTPGVTQFFEIKGGQLAKGPHLVNVVRQQQPGKTLARLDLNDVKKRQVVATFDGLKGNIQRPAAPHRLSVSLDGRHLVRTALPTVRAHPVRHPIQLRNRTLVATPQQQASSSITIAAPSKATSLPNSVVANLLQKNVMAKGGQRIAIASSAQGLANVQTFTAFTHAQQLKVRQARTNTTTEIVDVSMPTTSAASNPTAEPLEPEDPSTNGTVRRRAADTLPMEVT